MKFKWTKDFTTILRNPYTRKVFRWTHIFAECFQWLFIKKMKTILEIHENEINLCRCFGQHVFPLRSIEA